MVPRSYYDLLGVPRTASQAEIKAAYRALARVHHPDQRGGDDDDERFKAIAEAYRVLGDSTTRAEYDRSGAAPAGAAYTPVPAPPPTLSEVFTGAAAAARRFTARRGPDVRIEVGLDVRAIARGTRRVFELPRRGPDGAIQRRRLEYTLPPGLRHGQVLRWRGDGGPSDAGGRPGDLIVVIASIAHPTLERRDRDLVASLPVSYPDLLDGATVDVPTVFGPRPLTIPPRTRPGTELRIPGLGVGGETPGDAVFVAELAWPTEPLDGDTRDRLRRIERPRAFAAALAESIAWGAS
ncbi:MAG: DnaJ domain-containing protein [Myxococcales bacterium]|nr:DnaJ domain-containing protein [Myxococcales bacterium]MCB9530546.1 DnaJ domain-containing protein [Myxococcales bacterium]